MSNLLVHTQHQPQDPLPLERSAVRDETFYSFYTTFYNTHVQTTAL